MINFPYEKAEMYRAFALKIGMKAPPDFSNLAAPTLRNSFPVSGKLSFLTVVSSVADSVADNQVSSSKVTRKILRSKSGFIYRPARLVAPENFDLSQEWYIIFYCTDQHNKRLFRKRVLKEEFRAILDPEARKVYAKQAIKEINLLLYNDWHTESAGELQPKIDFDFSHFTLLKAIDYVKAIKADVEGVKPTTIKEYNATRSTLVDFMQYAGISQDYPLTKVNDSFLTKYFDYLKQVRGSTNKTYNARRLMLHAVFNTLLSRDKKLFDNVNPVRRIKFLKTESKTHTAYTDDQLRQIREAITKGNEKHLLLFIRFMYFTLARPEELRFLKVGDIDLSNRRILFRSEIAKTMIEQHVGINDAFAEIILESRILEFPAAYYVFSNSYGGSQNHVPGPTPVAKSYIYKRIKPYVVSLGFYRLNSNYTLYSFKHTGAISLYKATRDIKLVQAQCRHQSIEQTNIYLRDLGVLSDFDLLNKWKGSI